MTSFMKAMALRCALRCASSLALALAALGSAATLGAQTRHALPFAVGEKLTYETRAGRIFSGHAELWIEGPVEVQGVQAMVLRFSFATRVGPLGVSNQSTSWLDATRMATLRFAKKEQQLMRRQSEDVTIDRLTGHWRDADGREGDAPSPAPLDELSFIYFIRTLELPNDSAVQLVRHFDADRNPTTVRLIGRDSVSSPAGRVPTREIEMRVRDSRHYKGDGVIRFSISDDACRRPLRIESTMPGAGTVVMTLVAAEPSLAGCGVGLAIAPRR